MTEKREREGWMEGAEKHFTGDEQQGADRLTERRQEQGKERQMDECARGKGAELKKKGKEKDGRLL